MTKERLRNYREIKKERDQIRHQLEEIEAALYYPKVQHLTGMPSAPSAGNHQEDLAIHHLELQDRYRAKLEELAAEQLAIEGAIDSLDTTSRTLLRYRYIDGMKWEEICVLMNYAWAQVHRIHAQALQQLRVSEE